MSYTTNLYVTLQYELHQEVKKINKIWLQMYMLHATQQSLLTNQQTHELHKEVYKVKQLGLSQKKLKTYEDLDKIPHTIIKKI